MSAALEAMLDRTHAAALMGDLQTLVGLAPETEALAGNLQGLDLATAQALRAKAERNAALLQAALRGLRAARARLDEISDGPTLTFYDARGRKAVVAPSDSGTDRRL